MGLVEDVSNLLAHAQQIGQQYPQLQQPIAAFMQDLATMLQQSPAMQGGFQSPNSTPSSPNAQQGAGGGASGMQGAMPMQGQMMGGNQPPY